jgi:hypothetical protein
MKTAYRVLAGLIAISVVIQAAAIGLAWFIVLNEVNAGAVYDESSEFNAGHLTHSIMAIVIVVLGLALLIVSFFTKVSGAVRRALIVFGLIVLQWVLAIVAFSMPAVGALHGINALALAGAAGWASTVVRPRPEPVTAASDQVSV